MAKDFADVNRLQDEADHQVLMQTASEVDEKEERVSAFVRAWESRVARRATKGSLGLTMALTLAACGGSDDDDPAPTTPVEPTDPTPTANIFKLVADGTTELSGEDPIVEVPSEDAGAETLSTTIGGDGTGTLELRFDQDEDDTVVLAAASDLGGYDTLAITAGTVDVRAVDLSSIETITVASGVTLTAAQFLGLENGIEGGSDDAEVTIQIATAEEAADVIAAIAQLSGTLGSGDIVLQQADGSDLDAADMEDFQSELDGALVDATVDSALPQALVKLAEAEQAQQDFVEKLAGSDLVDVGKDDTFVDAKKALTTAISTAEKTAPLQGVVSNDDTADQNDANIAAKRADLAEAIAQAEEAVADARKAVVDGDGEEDAALQAYVDRLYKAQKDVDAAHNDEFHPAQKAVETALEELFGAAAANVVLKYDPRSDEKDVDGEHKVFTTATYADQVVLQVNSDGEVVKGAALELSEDGKTYEVRGDDTSTPELDPLTLKAADVDELVGLLQAERDAFEDMLDAEEALAKAIGDLNDHVGGNAAASKKDMNVNVGSVEFSDPEGVIAKYYDSLVTLDEKKADETDFEEALADWQDLVALKDEADDLGKSVQDALDDIQNATDADDAGLGIEVVNFDEGIDGVPFGDGDQVYIFDADDADGGSLEVMDFASDGVDRIAFDSAYELVPLDDAFDSAEPTGDASALEIFAHEDVNDVVLTVEGEAFAGSGSGTADLTTVRLKDVDFASLDLGDAGILTADAQATV